MILQYAVNEAVEDAEAVGWTPGLPGLLPILLGSLHRWIHKFDPAAIPLLEATGRAIAASQGPPREFAALWREDEANAAMVLGFAALVVEELMLRQNVLG